MNVIVTGAAQGIGEGVARHLAAEGHRLVLADIQAAAVAAVARDLGASSVEVDIASPESAREMARRAIAALGHVDAIVNVAGLDAPRGTALTTDDELWRRVVDVDLSGPWWCTKALLEHFLERGGGRVVIISSVAAWRGHDQITPAYSAAKAGLHGLVTGARAPAGALRHPGQRDRSGCDGDRGAFRLVRGGADRARAERAARAGRNRADRAHGGAPPGPGWRLDQRSDPERQRRQHQKVARAARGYWPPLRRSARFELSVTAWAPGE